MKARYAKQSGEVDPARARIAGIRAYARQLIGVRISDSQILYCAWRAGVLHSLPPNQPYLEGLSPVQIITLWHWLRQELADCHAV